MRVSTNLYLYHTSWSLLMRVFRPLRIKECYFLLLFCILTHSCLLHPPHLTRISGPLSTKRFIFLACILHISASRLALTSHVVKSIYHNTHTHTLLTSVQEPPRFACLYRTDSQSSTVIYPTHVLVCLRSFCFVHTARMTFGPLSTVPTGGIACATEIGWPH